VRTRSHRDGAAKARGGGSGGAVKAILAAAALVTLATGPALGQPARATPATLRGEEARVLAAVDNFFAAVHDKDRARIMAAVLPEGQATSIRLDGGPPFRSWHWPTYIENSLAPGDAWTERLIAPQVRVERDLATVWARYELIAGDQFSHCGVDHFELVRRDGRWLVYNLTWTNQTRGCPGR
jgi:hypothetical protein